METVIAFRAYWQQLMFSFSNPFVVPDRALKTIMRERAEQIDAARRYWACPF
jgi:hypothetical protein